MLSLSLYFVDQPYTSHELPSLVSSSTLFPMTCWAMNVCELTLAVSPPHRRRTGGRKGAALHFMNSHLWWVHATLFPTTCWAMNVCELTLAVSGGATRRGVWSDLGGVSQLTLAPTILSSFYIYSFIRLPLCNKYSDVLCHLSLYTLLLYMLSSLAHVWDAPGFVP
jgi:hypothetical protein